MQTLEDMDLIFGDTAAHEEKKRIKRIEGQLRGTPVDDDDEDLKKDGEEHEEMVG